MAVSWGVDTCSMKPKTNTAIGQYLFVEVEPSTDDTVDIPSAITRPLLGIVQNSVSALQATAGVPVQVKFTGGSKVRLGTGGCVAGDTLGCHATDGRAIVAAANTSTVRAIALNGGAENDVIDCILVFARTFS